MYTCTDDYRFESTLGNGTFGTVYLVRRKKDSKPFVIKEQDLDSVNYSASKIVLEEVQCLRKMRHPNIVSYHGAWIAHNHSYILMEYATRCTLKDLLEKRKIPLKEEDALYLFSQVTLGVHHIHSKEILHRDLKPENIMLTGSRGDIVKIGDFGVSKSLHEKCITCRAGSYYYMAPEMLTAQPYDFKCDVWSMGVILYEMITKRLPYPATSLVEITKLVFDQPPKPLPEGTPVPIVNLISKMLRKQSPSRPRTDQLVLCPFLVPYIVRIYLNVGRIINLADRESAKFGPRVFLKFLKPPNFRQNETVQ
ncbi:PREDICTED: serine/threonine-protein kinase nekl-2-like [Dinoponera quadriceps]|uniref:non-specific serine/threonine protein kinase n=1 Tax=Dinoponera quadriceps TaxID=609295 RepID=A0A6P3XQJ3_DINQU|nr:PREDICTED: serine/threonine-protein kinase nekl-2-like [Dinoponera quadriceps]